MQGSSGGNWLQSSGSQLVRLRKELVRRKPTLQAGSFAKSSPASRPLARLAHRANYSRSVLPERFLTLGCFAPPLQPGPSLKQSPGLFLNVRSSSTGYFWGKREKSEGEGRIFWIVTTLKSLPVFNWFFNLTPPYYRSTMTLGRRFSRLVLLLIFHIFCTLTT
jgi:hypothetical protein